MSKYRLLTSASNDQSSTRSFCEFKSREEIARKLIGYFEDYLMETRCGTEEEQNNPHLEYISDELFEFLDTFFGELVCLERDDERPDLWTPYPSDWVKEAVYMYLKRLSEQDEDNETIQLDKAVAMETS